jgi:hypothetical protein
VTAENASRLDRVFAAIDAANARDPHLSEIEGRREPAALLYGRRMSETLALLAPEAAETLRIAARGQHIERWTSPRRTYPEGRVGYLKWRKDLSEFHARRLAAIMREAGYAPEEVARVGALVRKERLKLDPEVQILEDVACIVFLMHYAGDFGARTDQAKLAGILTKTWRKMSDQGRAYALKLDLPGNIARLLERSLAGQAPPEGMPGELD